MDVDGVRLGAKVRWRDIEKDPRLASVQPLLQAAVGHVAHYQIRNRGTIGGSLARGRFEPTYVQIVSMTPEEVLDRSQQ